MFMFRIWHGSSSKQPATGELYGSSRPTDLVFCGPDHPNRRRRRLRGALTGPRIQIFPASRAQPGTIHTAERLHRRRQDDVFAQHGSQLNVIALIEIAIVAFSFLLDIRLQLDRCRSPLAWLDGLRLTSAAFRLLAFPSERRMHRER